MEEENVTVTIGEGVAVIRRKGQSRPVVANILGIEHDESGRPKTVWLDRLVHRYHESRFIGWSVFGALSSVLTVREEANLR